MSAPIRVVQRPIAPLRIERSPARPITVERLTQYAPVLRLPGVAGQQGPVGSPGPSFGGFGFTDLGDPLAGMALALPAGTWVRVSRALAASPANAALRGAYAGHLFWDGAALIRPLGLKESFAVQFFYRVVAYVADGFFEIEVRPGGNRALNQGPGPIVLTEGAGVEESNYTAAHVCNVRPTFAAQGAEVWVRLTRGGELRELSPEFTPLSEPA